MWDDDEQMPRGPHVTWYPTFIKRDSTKLPLLLYPAVFDLCKVLKWNYLQTSMFISWSFLQRLFWWLNILKSMNVWARRVTCSRGPSYQDPKKLRVVISGLPQGMIFIMTEALFSWSTGWAAGLKKGARAPPPIYPPHPPFTHACTLIQIFK